MRITESQLESQLDAFGPEKIRIVGELAHQGPPDGVGPALLLAMGSRETNLANITGDGGHGRGWLQIDDRFFAVAPTTAGRETPSTRSGRATSTRTRRIATTRPTCSRGATSSRGISGGAACRREDHAPARTASTSCRSSRMRAMARSRVGPIEPSGMSACCARRL